MDQRLRRITRVWAGFALLLFASTWKLWTPQTEFPQIPFFEILIDVPGWVDWAALAIGGLSLTIGLFSSSRSRVLGSLWMFAIVVSLLVLLNQHRLQPWVYQLLAFAIIMAAARPCNAITWMRWIVISIYIFSAISKFDYQFIHTVGEEVLWWLADKFGVDTSAWSPWIRSRIVFSFPLAELLIGLGLMIPGIRRIAVFAAVMMHMTLLAALLGNVDGLSVIFWNLYFVVQAVLLFGNPPNLDAWQKTEATGTKTGEPRQLRSDADRTGYLTEPIAAVTAMFVLLFPLTQPFGICDHWPAWQVYAPRSSRARIVRIDPTDGLWADPSGWSEKTLRAPVYPQARFQLAISIAAQVRFPEANGLPIEVSGESDRWTGARPTELLTGDQIRMQVERYWLNLKPRGFWREERTALQ